MRSSEPVQVSQSAPHGLKPWIKKGGRGRLIGRTKGGMNTKLHAVTDEKGALSASLGVLARSATILALRHCSAAFHRTMASGRPGL